MNHATHADAEGPARRSRFELIFASICLAFGLFVLPALVYMVGTLIFGAYGPNQDQGLGSFYLDYFADLAEPAGRAWILALGPLLLAYLVRLIFIGVRPRVEPIEEKPPAAAPERPARTRVEPRVSVD